MKPPADDRAPSQSAPSSSRRIRLGDVAHCRSGDKGDRANIGVVANDAAAYDWLKARLTPRIVAAFLRPMGIGPVTRYELPKIRAFNFVVERALAGGASRSLRIDTQGKALGTALMDLELEREPDHNRESAPNQNRNQSRNLKIGDRIMNEPSVVLREDVGPIVVLTLNRPDRRNALSRRLMDELGDVLSRLALDPAARVLVLTGSGTCFCAGMDLHEAVAASESASSEELAVSDAKEIAHLINQIHRFPKPTIAELNGRALGGGAGLALACDLVVMSDRAGIGFPEVLRGLVPSIVLHDLVRQIGDKRVRQLVLTGGVLEAVEAVRWGLANAAVESDRLRDATLELANRLLAAGPRAAESAKRLIDEAGRRPRDLAGAAAISAAARVGDEAAEGMRAFTEKRPPKWNLSR